MKPSPISAAIPVLSLFLASSLLAQSPDSTNQSTASPASSASATALEVPRLIKFSGTLLDTQDRPMAGPVGVSFALHAQQAGGAALWLETQNVTPDAHGSYTVLLGANSANGVPAELFASGEARWLEVQVERQAEQPRVLLVSVPYALKAKDAETLGGKPLSSFVLNETQAAVNSAASATATSSSSASGALPKSSAVTTPKKAASSTQPAAACTNVTSGGAATSNSIALFTAPCNIESSLMTQALINGFPGVTVAGNNAGLLLNGTGTHQVTVTGASSGRLGQDANGFFFASDTNAKSVRFLTNNGALNEWMRITSAGNVGIGTKTPAATLDVAGNVNATSFTGNGAGLTNVAASNIEDTGRIAYQSTVNNVGKCSGTSCLFSFPAVPANHRVVVQHIGGILDFNTVPTNIAVFVQGGAAGFLTEFFAPIPTAFLFTAFDQPILFYVDALQSPQVQVFIIGNSTAFAGDSTSQFVTLMGYELDCSVSPCSPIATQ
jgi:hypothetical protein